MFIVIKKGDILHFFLKMIQNKILQNFQKITQNNK